MTELARRFDARIAEPPPFDADPVRASYEAAAVAPIGPLDAQRLLAADDAARGSPSSRSCSRNGSASCARVSTWTSDGFRE